MPYTIYTAKATIKDAQGNSNKIDVFVSDKEKVLADIESAKEEALQQIGTDNQHGVRGTAITEMQTIANEINRSTSNQLTDASAINNWNIQRNAVFIKMFGGGTKTHPQFTKVSGTWDSEGTFIPN